MSSLKRPGAPGRIVGIAAGGFILTGKSTGVSRRMPKNS